ncbi:MAG: RHS repeat-associated core domain-containing protein [Caldilinea sp. CFX5]|nr:RHS repeat-associated core domain-containing protein [Caldilinea sp. CFX5]
MYVYDGSHSATNRSRGQLTYVSNGLHAKALNYNAQGQLAREEVWISGVTQNYFTYYGYDSYLRPNTVTYPDGEFVTTNYNAMGQPNRLRSSWYGDLVDGTTTGGGITNGVGYDEAGRLTQMRFPLGGNLWQTRSYMAWLGSNGNANGRLDTIKVGTAPGNTERMQLTYQYDSFGNVLWFYENGTWFGFCYDSQNRLTRGYALYNASQNCTNYTTGRTYSYDSAGRLTNYEGTGMTVVRGHSTFPTGAGYSFDNNGNYTALGGSQTLSWDHENRLSQVVVGGSWTESYLYDADGQRVKKTSGGVATYYPNQYYEQSGSTVTKYYYFNGQRVAMRVNGILTYLHSDHLGGTALATNSSGNVITDQGYYAYGRYRRGGALPTDHKFTGQKLDATGLYYYNARYYNPDSGQFLSPDTLVPEPTNLFDYNRYAYARLNPMKYNDPTGHQSSCMTMPPSPLTAPLILSCQIGEMAMRYGPTVIQLASQWADKLPAVDWLFSNTAEQGANSAGQQNAGNSGNTSSPNGWDPNDPWNSFRNSGMAQEGIDYLQKAARRGTVNLEKAYNQYNDLMRKGVDMGGHAVEQAQLDRISTQRIADTFTGTARNTQYFWQGGNAVQWSPHTNVALIIDKSTRLVTTVFERTSVQKDWLPMSAFEKLKWLGQ